MLSPLTISISGDKMCFYVVMWVKNIVPKCCHSFSWLTHSNKHLPYHSHRVNIHGDDFPGPSIQPTKRKCSVDSGVKVLAALVYNIEWEILHKSSHRSPFPLGNDLQGHRAPITRTWNAGDRRDVSVLVQVEVQWKPHKFLQQNQFSLKLG